MVLQFELQRNPRILIYRKRVSNHLTSSNSNQMSSSPSSRIPSYPFPGKQKHGHRRQHQRRLMQHHASPQQPRKLNRHDEPPQTKPVSQKEGQSPKNDTPSVLMKDKTSLWIEKDGDTNPNTPEDRSSTGSAIGGMHSDEEQITSSTTSLFTRTTLYAPMAAYNQNRVEPSEYLRSIRSISQPCSDSALFVFLPIVSRTFHWSPHSLHGKNTSARTLLERDYRECLDQRTVTLVSTNHHHPNKMKLNQYSKKVKTQTATAAATTIHQPNAYHSLVRYVPRSWRRWECRWRRKVGGGRKRTRTESTPRDVDSRQSHDSDPMMQIGMVPAMIWRNEQEFLQQMNQRWNSYVKGILGIPHKPPDMPVTDCTTVSTGAGMTNSAGTATTERSLRDKVMALSKSIEWVGCQVRLDKCPALHEWIGCQGILITITRRTWQFIPNQYIVPTPSCLLIPTKSPVLIVPKKSSILTVLVPLDSDSSYSDTSSDARTRRYFCVVLQG